MHILLHFMIHYCRRDPDSFIYCESVLIFTIKWITNAVNMTLNNEPSHYTHYAVQNTTEVKLDRWYIHYTMLVLIMNDIEKSLCLELCMNSYCCTFWLKFFLTFFTLYSYAFFVMVCSYATTYWPHAFNSKDVLSLVGHFSHLKQTPPALPTKLPNVIIW